MSSKHNSPKLLTCLFAAVALVAFYSPVAKSEVQIFACWEDIVGGSEDRNFVGCSEVDSYSLIVGELDDGADTKQKNPMQCEQNVSMQFDTASPDLALLALTKDTINFDVSFVDKSGAVPVVVLVIDSTDWIVKRVASGGVSNDSPALQEIVFNPSGTNTTTIEKKTDGGSSIRRTLDCTNG